MLDIFLLDRDSLAALYPTRPSKITNYLYLCDEHAVRCEKSAAISHLKYIFIAAPIHFPLPVHSRLALNPLTSARGCCARRGCHGDAVTLTTVVASCDPGGGLRRCVTTGPRSPRLLLLLLEAVEQRGKMGGGKGGGQLHAKKNNSRPHRPVWQPLCWMLMR